MFNRKDVGQVNDALARSKACELDPRRLAEDPFSRDVFFVQLIFVGGGPAGEVTE